MAAITGNVTLKLKVARELLLESGGTLLLESGDKLLLQGGGWLRYQQIKTLRGDVTFRLKFPSVSQLTLESQDGLLLLESGDRFLLESSVEDAARLFFRRVDQIAGDVTFRLLPEAAQLSADAHSPDAAPNPFGDETMPAPRRAPPWQERPDHEVFPEPRFEPKSDLFTEDTIYEMDVFDSYIIPDRQESPVIHPEPTVQALSPQPPPQEGPRVQGGIGAVPAPQKKSDDTEALLVLMSSL
jgi:hypothetical protein